MLEIDINKLIELVKSTKSLIVNEDVENDYDEKGKADYVTRVDVNVQNYLKENLLNLYPQIQFMGEEKDNSDIDLESPLWVLDPIDGTTNLIHHYMMSAVSLGLMIDKKPFCGVVYNPFTDELFSAVKNEGAYLNGKQIFVNNANSLEKCLVSIGTSPYEKYRAEENFVIFKNIFIKAQDIRRSGSAALDLCYAAAGRLGGYLERGLKPWDYTAGSIIVQEAGGKVTNWENEEIEFGTYSDIISSNTKVHSELIFLTKI